MHESFPDLYPRASAPDEIEPGANIVNLFEIIKKVCVARLAEGE
jgi:hypothetical protein